jgi:hypothetical protein
MLFAELSQGVFIKIHSRVHGIPSSTAGLAESAAASGSRPSISA